MLFLNIFTWMLFICTTHSFNPYQPNCWFLMLLASPPPRGMSLLLMTTLFSQVCSPLVCRNICERIHSEKIVFGISNYSLGQKYCRRCKVYMYNKSSFCPCCGMQLRLKPCSRICKEILRKRNSRDMEMVDG
jgi:hypothetical protein